MAAKLRNSAKKAVGGGNSQTRIAYIDSMKGFAILCVVIGHVPEIYIAHNIVNSNTAKLLFDIMNAVYTFHMPLFMMISGYVYSLAYFEENRKPDRARIYRQAGNMAIVYVIFNLLYALLKVLFVDILNSPLQWKDVLLIWAKPIYTPFWYLYVLAIFYIIFSLERLNEANPKKLLVALSIVSLAASFTHIDWFKISNILFFAVFFYIGMIHCKHPKYIIGNRNLSLATFLVAILLTIVFWDRKHFESFEKMVRIEQIPIIKAIVALGICLAIWQLFETKKALQRDVLLRYLGSHSLEIYLMHNMLLSGICIIFVRIGIRNVLVNILLNVVLSIAIPIVISHICKRLKIYELLFKPLTFIRRIVNK